MNIQTGLIIFLISFNLLSMWFFYLILSSRFSKNRLSEQLRTEVEKLIIDLGREADRDVAILESRIQNLRTLIDEADRRILLADKVSAKKSETEQKSAELHNIMHKTPVVEPDSRIEPITVYTRPLIQRSDKQVAPFIPLNERVLDMARKGISPELIASTLSLSLGEIELILDMNSSSL